MYCIHIIYAHSLMYFFCRHLDIFNNKTIFTVYFFASVNDIKYTFNTMTCGILMIKSNSLLNVVYNGPLKVYH